MPNFITRIELHGASTNDYERLHAAMAVEKFHRVILDDQGKRYQLPTAEYFSHGETLTVETVRDLADRAAAKIAKPYWVLVSQYERAAWRLPEIKPVNALAALPSGLKPNPLTSVF
jgi:hypothetical protein